ncbi:leucine rich repeat protein [Ichthyophthirius multifiliis]|uniref:Leucine rich repeat protein n=1 Tax=Ichthyophthirius multifiliis TaxID=5932 RepID=G0QN04_ICHMU|nr:leucine rich repeat protein [Ichthyophthirius multifiliis]EGR33402.1 leucine rich repeat protein [Ichthyophthirius multifiliis]|eukprot:XP_004037388.1 leucine rich repeat protein [Ichthyophthirius multifiliis]
MGKPLTEDLIKQKTKTEAIHLVKNLNLWGQELDDLHVLKGMPNLEVLSLSVNQISSLKYIKCCLKIKELYLRKNSIQDITEIRHLVNLPELKVLWLCDNPCANIPNYRETVIKSLPNLQKLDNTPITQEEINQAQAFNVDFIDLSRNNSSCSQKNTPPNNIIKISKLINQMIINMEYKIIIYIIKYIQILINKQIPNNNFIDNEKNMNKNQNIVIAILSLVKELDSNSLEIIKRDIDKRLRQINLTIDIDIQDFIYYLDSNLLFQMDFQFIE